MIDLLFLNDKPQNSSIEQLVEYTAKGIICEDLARYFTDSPEIIRKRQEIYRDLTEAPGMRESARKIYELLCDLICASESAGSRIAGGTNETVLNVVCALSSYVSFIEESFRELKMKELRSEGLKKLFSYIKSEIGRPEFLNLKNNLNGLTANIKDAKSVTVGINLDENLRPIEAGLVSVNSVPYGSARFLDRLFSGRLNGPREFECICPISKMAGLSSRDETEVINRRLNGALDSVLRNNFKKISKETKRYLDSVCSELTGVKEALEFYLSAVNFFDRAIERGLPVRLPDIDAKKYRISDLYDRTTADQRGVKETVPNSISFDDRGRIYVLIGANSGGKTVFLRSLGFAQLMFQLGLPVFAKDAVMYPFSDIHLYLVSDTDSAGYGRFENEVRWLAERIKIGSGKALYLLDELFSSTNASEAGEIAFSALGKIRKSEGSCVFSTHLYDLAKRISDSKNTCDLNEFDVLAIETEGDEPTHRVLRGASIIPESKAVSLAREYGIL